MMLDKPRKCKMLISPHTNELDHFPTNYINKLISMKEKKTQEISNGYLGIIIIIMIINNK